ncbi:MAG: MFS transporter [Candidatus Njordarchaeia archaeon]
MYFQVDKKMRNTLIFVMLGWIFDAFDAFLITIMISPIAKEFHLDFVGQAAVIGITLGATGIGGFMFGYIADRIGRARALTLSILTYSIFTGLTGFVTHFYQLVIVRLLAGLGIGGEWASGMTLLSENVDPKIRGTAIGLVQCGWPLGVFLASLDQMYVYPLFGWRGAFYVAALPGIILAFAGKFAPESHIWEHKIEKRQHSSKAELLSLILGKYRRPFFVALGMDVFAMFSYWLFWSWYITFLKVEVGVSVASSAVWLMVTQIGAFAGYLLYGVLQDLYGRRITWTTFTFLEGLFIIMFVQLAYSTKDTMFLLALGLPLGFFTGYWSGFGAILSESFPTKVRATFSGICFNTGRLVSVAGLLMQAYLIAFLGFNGILMLASLFSVIAGTFIWFLKETRGIDLNKIDEVEIVEAKN